MVQLEQGRLVNERIAMILREAGYPESTRGRRKRFEPVMAPDLPINSGPNGTFAALRRRDSLCHAGASTTEARAKALGQWGIFRVQPLANDIYTGTRIFIALGLLPHRLAEYSTALSVGSKPMSRLRV